MVPGAKQRSEEAYKKAKGTIEEHKDTPRKQPEVHRSGGDDESRSGKGRKGGFDLPPEVPTTRA